MFHVHTSHREAYYTWKRDDHDDCEELYDYTSNCYHHDINNTISKRMNEYPLWKIVKLISYINKYKGINKKSVLFANLRGFAAETLFKRELETGDVFQLYGIQSFSLLASESDYFEDEYFPVEIQVLADTTDDICSVYGNVCHQYKNEMEFIAFNPKIKVIKSEIQDGKKFILAVFTNEKISFPIYKGLDFEELINKVLNFNIEDKTFHQHLSLRKELNSIKKEKELPINIKVKTHIRMNIKKLEFQYSKMYEKALSHWEIIQDLEELEELQELEEDLEELEELEEDLEELEEIEEG